MDRVRQAGQGRKNTGLQFARPSGFGNRENDLDLGQMLRDCLALVDHVLSEARIAAAITGGVRPAYRRSRTTLACEWLA